jgi:DNA-binding transcriptional MerR regulator
MNAGEPLWTLDELCAQVALALAVNYTGTNNGRVRDVPDRRTVRYYTTLGLIDRPAAMRGRVALYSRRHLLQLAAIKRLQSRGLALTEVQSRLIGLTSGALEALAELPPDFAPGAPAPAVDPLMPGDSAAPEGEESEVRREEFWREVPAAPPPVASLLAEARTATEAVPVRTMAAVTLDAGVTLVLESNRPLHDHDLAALRAAAAPLVKLLQVRRLSGAGVNNLGNTEGQS